MKISIFDEAAPEKEREITLRLIKEHKEGPIVVAVVDKTGKTVHCGRLMKFQNNVTFTRAHNIDPELGLSLDGYGRLLEKKR